MGYYDDEPQAGDMEPIIDVPSAQLESVDAAISEDIDGELGDGLHRLQFAHALGY